MNQIYEPNYINIYPGEQIKKLLLLIILTTAEVFGLQWDIVQNNSELTISWALTETEIVKISENPNSSIVSGDFTFTPVNNHYVPVYSLILSNDISDLFLDKKIETITKLNPETALISNMEISSNGDIVSADEQSNLKHITLKDYEHNGTILQFFPLLPNRDNSISLVKEITFKVLAKSGTLKKYRSPETPVFAKKSFKNTLPQHYVKIVVSEPGYYRIYGKDLKTLDIKTANINPTMLKMTLRGNDIPLKVSSYSDTFLENDFLDFYVETISNPYGDYQQNPYTTEDVLLLSWEEGLGKRYIEESGSIDGASDYQPQYFDYTIKFEESDRFDKLSQLDADYLSEVRDHWFFEQDIISGKSAEFIFNLDYPAPTSSPVNFNLKFQGLTYGDDSDHSVILLFNNIFLAQDSWEGQAEKYITNNNQNYLNSGLTNGNNSLQVILSGDPTIAQYYDKIYLDWLEVTYEKQFFATDGQLKFNPPNGFGSGTYLFELHGFSSSDITLLKNNFSWIRDYLVYYNNDHHSYSLLFQDEIINSSTSYFATCNDQVNSPDSLIYIDLVNTYPVEEQGDFIILCNDPENESIQAFKTFKSNQGFTPVVYSAENIYDYYEYGNISPYAIQHFLKEAHNTWSVKPEYLCLIGDARTDNRLSVTDDMMLPTQYFQTYRYGACVTDVWFGDLDDDYYQDIIVGRIPVESEEELDATIQKIINYNENLPVDYWLNRMTTIAGYEDDFKYQTESLINNLIPEHLQIDRIYMYPGAETSNYYGTTETLTEMINDGKVLINFLGHGGGAVWADRSLFVLEDINNLQNSTKAPFITSMTCFTATFETERGLGESMICNENGAIGFFGSSGLGWIQNDFLLIQPIYKHLFSGDISVGEAIRNGKLEYYATTPYSTHKKTMYYQYNLLGDPSQKLPVIKDATALTINPKDIQPDESVDISVNTTATQGLMDITFNYANDSRTPLLQKIPVSVTNNIASATIDTLIPAEGDISLFLWDENSGFYETASASFSVGGSFIAKPGFYQGDIPDTGDSRAISVEIIDSDGIFSAKIRFSDNSESTLSRSKIENIYLSDEFTWNETAGKYFKIIVEDNKANVTESPLFNLKPMASYDIALLDFDIENHISTLSIHSTSYEPVQVQFDFQSIGASVTHTFIDTLTIHYGMNTIPSGYIAPYGDLDLTIKMMPRNESSEDSSNNTLQISLQNYWIPVNNNLIGSETALSLEDSIFIQITAQAGNAESYIFIETLEKQLDVSSFGYSQSVSNVLYIDSETDELFLTAKINKSTLPASINSSIFYINTSLNESYIVSGLNETFSIQRPGYYLFAESFDESKPKIDLMVNSRKLLDESYISEYSQFSVLIQDNFGAHPLPGFYQIILDGDVADQSILNCNYSQNNDLSIQILPDLDRGDHSFRVLASDLSGNTDSTEIFTFFVSGEAKIIDYGNFPNPFQSRTLFIYELTDQFDDLQIHIYTVSGKKIITLDSFNSATDSPMFDVGYHEINWNGLDKYDEFIANGVYFYEIFAEKDNKIYRKRGKVVKVR